MSLTSSARTIDELTAKAAGMLARGDLFEAERHGARAVALARRESDFARMLTALGDLTETRLRRFRQACEPGTVTIVDQPFNDDVRITTGCYLVQPPLVGADARRLRQQAYGRGVAAGVLCREPIIRLGLMPMVALGADATVRVKVHRPADVEHPDLDWFIDSLAALGDAATEIDPEMDVEKRIDQLLARLDAIPDHEGLHRCLEATCREALDAQSSGHQGG